MQRHSVTSLETARSLANISIYSAFPGNCSVSYRSFVYGRSLWAVLNGGEITLHWKANMLPLFSIMTLCKKLARQNRNVDKAISLYLVYRKCVELFLKFNIFKIVVIRIFCANFNGVFVYVCFIVLRNKKYKFHTNIVFYIKISHSSSSSTEMTSHQPIRGRDARARLCIPVL